MGNDDWKLKFLRRELLSSSWSASVQHNPTYLKSAEQVTIGKFRDAMFSYLLSQIEPLYQGQITDEQHFINIEALMKYAEEKGRSVLMGGKYKAANAQKLLNLYLKYLWCAGLVETPPHCPVDSIILAKAKIHGKSWTKMLSVDDYREVISLLKKVVNVPLAPWELQVYSRR
jgi:hypothetical protein